MTAGKNLSLFLLLVFLAGCTNLPFIAGQEQPTGTFALVPSAQVTATPQVQETLAFSTPAATLDATQGLGSLVRIWLPPEFDPAGNSPASKLLKSRLDQFTIDNPDVRLEVRVKDLEGPGGLLDALAAANTSAPLTLPDLVLLPRSTLEAAASKGLLTPFDGLTSIMQDRSWFHYAQQLAHINTNIYGLPFAGDAMVAAYRPALAGTIPRRLEDLPPLGAEMLFPASDPQALFTLEMYLDQGGSLLDAKGQPHLDEAHLASVLDFQQRASQAGVMPFLLTQYSTDEQVWETFTTGQHPMAVTWASTYLQNASQAEDLALSPLPTWNGNPSTLASGWSWSLAGQDPERRVSAARLAEYLVDKDFLAQWTSAAGYLPPRVDALQAWKDADLRQVIEQVSYSASLLPPDELVSALGPEIEQAVVEVLKAENNPQDAAKEVVSQVNQP